VPRRLDELMTDQDAQIGLDATVMPARRFAPDRECPRRLPVEPDEHGATGAPAES
jgi:hypothetical protein